jgi:hypothetical protein
MAFRATTAKGRGGMLEKATGVGGRKQKYF